MIRVTLGERRDYDRRELRAALEGLLEDLGGIRQFFSPGDRVLLKPNLLSASAPEKCDTTHPEVVRGVALLVLEAGGKPLIADSPGLDGFAKVGEKTGMAQVARELSIPLEELDDSSPLPMAEGSVFRKVEVARQALEADAIINLPKLKTHAQMTLTLGVKNLFGTVVRQRKAEWHYTTGLHRDIFADLHLDIARSLAPALTILDGIEGMEGRGPGNGTPRSFGLLAASPDPLALDLSVCSLLGVAPESFPLYRAAKKRGLLPVWEEMRSPSFPEGFVFPAVDIPRLDALHLLPAFLDGFAKRHLSSRPVQDRDKCIQCCKCVSLCPAGAMELTREGRILIDYEKCIRCYCCQEVCPEDALTFSRGLILRGLEFFHR
ncbi:DUF362 domain-containing protein [Aminivibrio sp.]